MPSNHVFSELRNSMHAFFYLTFSLEDKGHVDLCMGATVITVTLLTLFKANHNR